MGIGFGFCQIFLMALLSLLLVGNTAPDAMRAIGRGMREFRKGFDGIEEQSNR